MSFVEHCNTRRVENAVYILSSTELSITEVAFDSRFSNLSYLYFSSNLAVA